MPIPKNERVKQRWRPQRIKVVVHFLGESPKKDRYKTVKAEVYGQLALHEGQTHLSARKWAVTHVPCGLLVSAVNEEADARRIAEFLWDNFGHCFDDDPECTKRKVPERVVNWLKECRLQGKYVEPRWW